MLSLLVAVCSISMISSTPITEPSALPRKDEQSEKLMRMLNANLANLMGPFSILKPAYEMNEQILPSILLAEESDTDTSSVTTLNPTSSTTLSLTNASVSPTSNPIVSNSDLTTLKTNANTDETTTLKMAPGVLINKDTSVKGNTSEIAIAESTTTFMSTNLNEINNEASNISTTEDLATTTSKDLPEIKVFSTVPGISNQFASTDSIPSTKSTELIETFSTAVTLMPVSKQPLSAPRKVINVLSSENDVQRNGTTFSPTNIIGKMRSGKFNRIQSNRENSKIIYLYGLKYLTNQKPYGVKINPQFS